MRYELGDHGWSVIRPMPPNKPSGFPRATTGAFSTASSGSCDQVRRRNTLCCHAASAPRDGHCNRTVDPSQPRTQ